MDMDETPIFSGGLRVSSDAAIEQSGLLGAHRSWTNVNRWEVIFLILGILAAIVTDGLTIFRLAKLTSTRDPDFVYGILIIVNSLFLILFLFTGILQQRITDIVAFFVSCIMLTIYVIAQYVIRETDHEETEEKTRLARLIFTVVFDACFIPLSIVIIRDYQRDEFAQRLFGAFPSARWPLRIYNIFDCVARINIMLSISAFLLNLYNFNNFERADKTVLGIGIPLAFLWLGFGIGMIRLEKRLLVVVFYIISLFQLGFIVYFLYNAIDDQSSKKSTTPIFSSTTTAAYKNREMPNETTITATFSTPVTTSPNIVSVPVALYVCIALNLLTHISSMILGGVCTRNFGKGLKERVFNNKFDKWFQKRW